MWNLREEIRDELGTRDEPKSLESLTSLAIHLNNCLRERYRKVRKTDLPVLLSIQFPKLYQKLASSHSP